MASSQSRRPPGPAVSQADSQAELDVQRPRADSPAGRSEGQTASERSLRESEERLRLALKMANFGTYQRNIRTQRLQYSATVAEILGLPAVEFEESLDEAMARLHPDDRPGQLAAALDSRPETSGRREFRVIRPSGEIRWVEAANQILTGSDGEPEIALAVMADVTDRRLAEQALVANEERLRLALNMASFGTFHHDIRVQRLHYSATVAAILGLAPVEFDESMADSLARVHPDDRALIAEAAAKQRPTAPWQREYRILRPNGEVRWVSVAIQILIDRDGEPEIALAIMADITDRRLAEQAKFEDDQRLRLAIELEQLATWRRDLKQGTFHYSAITAELLGLPPEEFEESGEQALLHVHPDDRDRIAEVACRDYGGERADDTEFRIVRTDGGVRWLKSRDHVIADGDGQPLIVVTVARDITEEKAAETAMRDGRTRLELALEGADLGAWDLDITTGTITLDERAAAMLVQGRSGPQPMAEIGRHIHPDDRRELAAETAAHYRGDTPAMEAEYRTRHDDGRYHWIRSRGRVLERDASGRALRAAGTYMDVTEQRRSTQTLAESQADMRAMFENSGDGIILVDAEMRILRINAQARGAIVRLYGRQVEEGHPLSEFMDDPDWAPLQEGIAAVIASGLRQTGEWDLHAPGGAVPHEFEFVPILLGSGEFRGVGIAARNITTRKRNEAALAESQKLESVGRLVGGVAHDFNNLLGVILGFGQLAAAALESGSPAGQINDDLKEVLAAAESAAALTRQLLAFGRRQHVEPKNVDLNALILKTEKLLRRVIGEDIVLVCSPSVVPVVANIDPGQFEQVIINLAVNARDAMPEGGMLTVETKFAEGGLDTSLGFGSRMAPSWSGLRLAELPEGAYAVVEVSDTGSGMSEETLARAFEPFFTTKEVGRGTGLGLATCHGIVTQAGGRMSISSEPGSGTTVRICLPLRTIAALAGEVQPPGGPGETETPANPAKASDPPRADDRPPSPKATVLLVEDQEQVRAVTERILKRAGYSVVTAASPMQALEIASSRLTIDLVVSDIIMPVMDGVRMMELLTGILGPKPVLFVSGYADSALVATARSRPGARFLPKPCTAAALIAAAGEALAGSAAAA